MTTNALSKNLFRLTILLFLTVTISWGQPRLPDASTLPTHRLGSLAAAGQQARITAPQPIDAASISLAPEAAATDLSAATEAQPEAHRTAWRQANGPETGPVNSLFARGTTIFAGTQGGIFTSSDGGRNWRFVTMGPDSIIVQIAALGNALFATDVEARTASLWRSMDNGRSWQPAQNGLPPGLPQVWVRALGNTLVTFAVSGQVFRSTNGGNSWELASSGLPDGIGFANFASLGSTLLLASDKGLFRTTNNAASWQRVNLNVPNGVLALWGGAIGNRLLVGTTGAGVFVSDDQGATWKASNQGLPANAVAGGLDTIGSSIYVSTETGDLYESTDQGNAWTRRNEGFAQFRRVNNLIGSGGAILAATGDGVLRSTDGGRSWQRSSRGLRAALVLGQTSLGRFWFVATWGGGIWRSSDGGNSWRQMNRGIAPRQYLGVTAVTIFADRRTLYAGGFGHDLYRSDDFGATWEAIPDAIPEGDGAFNIKRVGHKLFVAKYFGGALVSADNGRTWAEVKGLSNFAVSTFMRAGTILYAMTYGDGMFRSDDDGATWQPINDGLNLPNATLVNEGTVFGGSLFIGTDGGLFRSDNYGFYWYLVGLPGRFGGVNDVKSFGQTLVATTYGAGVFMSDDDGQTWRNTSEGLTGKRLFYVNRIQDRIAVCSSGHGVFTTALPRD
jgi:photosystem II stability/assembly factor-like uncharacterized protein